MCVGSGAAGAGSHLQYFVCFVLFFINNNLYFHLTGPARTRPFLEEDRAGGEEGLLAAVVDLVRFC